MTPGLRQSNHLHFMDKKEALKEIITIFINGELLIDKDSKSTGYLSIDSEKYDRFFTLCREVMEMHFTKVILEYQEVWKYYGVISDGNKISYNGNNIGAVIPKRFKN